MERKIVISKLRTLTDTEIKLLEGGLKLLLIQGQKTYKRNGKNNDRSEYGLKTCYGLQINHYR